jgi:ATP-binding protein involved in chromosome partitioning
MVVLLVFKKKTAIANEFIQITKNLVSQVVYRNKNLPPTKAVEITNLVGCEAIKS